ncbi:hypothetical protein INT44_006720 [Umbelopsis vinacea]|uniref:PARP-type domain-containing protein n=1 Tax=Umbelopsis vinacea TaxID=44442 RepID=A0A8H7UAJ8_9FUNG|nr:hypothetical protein INT44_006720 [Umbelopsis vinacea]
MSDVKGADTSIKTYCVEYAQSQTSKCATCNRTIPNKSLRCGEIFRRSKKEKKQLSKTTWYHFKCFPVPELLTKLPIEQFRGYPAIEEKDQERIQKLLKLGKDATWNEHFGAQDKKKEAEEDESKPKKKKRDEDKPIDMTAGLTGQNPKSLKRPNKQAAEEKVAKKAKPVEPEVKLPKSDMSEVASISKAIQDSLATSKKTMALLEGKKKKKVQEKKD